MDERAVLRIGEVARRTGVAVPTLRAWERRYGVLDPQRTEGGHRLYSEADVARVDAVRQLLDAGWQTAAAAREVLRAPAPSTGPATNGAASRPATSADDGAGAASDELVRRLMDAVDTFDAAAADHVVDDVLARFAIPRALDEVLLPVLRQVGEGWQSDPRVIAREHFASNVLRPRLQRLLRAGPRAGQRTLVAAAPEHEEHDLGLLAAAAVAVDGGWRVHFLGARTPTRALEQGVADLAPHVVMVGAVFREHAEAFLADRPLLGAAAIVLGGGGFVDADLAELPRARLHGGGLQELATTLDDALGAQTSAG